MSEELVSRLEQQAAIYAAEGYLQAAVLLREAADALSRPAPAPVQVPSGWKLVPVEPTQEMLMAAVPFPEHLRLHHPDDATWESRMQAATAADQMVAAQTYGKMLSAAPSAPASPSVDAEKVIGLVEEYGRDCYKSGASQWPAESREYDRCADDTLAQIRALLTPAAIANQEEKSK